MNKQVSIESAIKKRKRVMVLRLPLFLLVGMIVGLTWKIKVNFLPDVLSGSLIGVVAGGITYYICKLYLIPKWFIWAFTHVDNMYELYRAAETEGVMLFENSWTAKHAIVSNASMQKMGAIYATLNAFIKSPLASVIADDSGVLQQTAIYVSTPKIIVLSIAIVLCGGAAASALFMALLSFLNLKESDAPPFLDAYPWLIFAPGLVVSMFAAMLFVKVNGILGKKKPKIIISSKGISTAKHGFTNWAEVKDEKVQLVSGGKKRAYVLSYEYTGGTAAVDLTNLKVNPIELNHLLTIYRLRSTAVEQ